MNRNFFYIAFVVLVSFAFTAKVFASLTFSDSAIIGSTASVFTGGTATTSDLTLQTTSGVGASGADMHFLVGNNGATEAMTILNSGNVGIRTTAPDKALEINSATGANLRLTYNDLNGSAANYADFAVSSSGDLTATPSGGDFNVVGGVYLGSLSGGAGTGTIIVETSSVGSYSLSFLDSTLGNEYLAMSVQSGVPVIISGVSTFIEIQNSIRLTGTKTIEASTGDLTLQSLAGNGDILLTPHGTGGVGIVTTAPDRALEINSATGINLRLTYNDSNGSAANYADLLTSSSGDLTITPSGGDTTITGNATITGRTLGAQGADVVAANDLTLGTDGTVFEITGATQINAITTSGWTTGSRITLIFASTPTVKHNTAGGAGTAVILLSAATDFSATAGDTLSLIYSEQGGTNAWREVSRTVI